MCIIRDIEASIIYISCSCVRKKIKTAHNIFITISLQWKTVLAINVVVNRVEYVSVQAVLESLIKN